MLRGLTSHKAFVEDVTAAERWYSDVLRPQPYFRSEDVGLPAGGVGFRAGDMKASWGSPTASSRPTVWEPDRRPPSPTGRSTTWRLPSIVCSPSGPNPSSPRWN